jgi:hypothetical protein
MPAFDSTQSRSSYHFVTRHFEVTEVCDPSVIHPLGRELDFDL